MLDDEHRSDQYYRKALPTSMWRSLLMGQQAKIYARFAELFPPRPETRVVNIGVNGQLERREQYILESRYPYLNQVVGAGLESADRYQALFPEASYVTVHRDQPYPFADAEFDVAFCSAVVEHVGAREDQRRFLHEVLRVAKTAFITTPNRWYPVELHTLVPLVHYLPTPIYRRVYRRLGFDFFSRETNLNLLDRAALRALLPPDRAFEIQSHHFLGLPSNLLLIARAVP